MRAEHALEGGRQLGASLRLPSRANEQDSLALVAIRRRDSAVGRRRVWPGADPCHLGLRNSVLVDEASSGGVTHREDHAGVPVDRRLQADPPRWEEILGRETGKAEALEFRMVRVHEVRDAGEARVEQRLRLEGEDVPALRQAFRQPPTQPFEVEGRADDAAARAAHLLPPREKQSRELLQGGETRETCKQPPFVLHQLEDIDDVDVVSGQLLREGGEEGVVDRGEAPAPDDRDRAPAGLRRRLRASAHRPRDHRRTTSTTRASRWQSRSWWIGTVTTWVFRYMLSGNSCAGNAGWNSLQNGSAPIPLLSS